jgi:hypothetical protein
MALAAAGMLASGPAAAQIELSLGGFFNAGVSMTSQDLDQNKRGHTFDREAEIFFRGSNTLDNGITVGVNVELEAETLGDQIDESYVYFSGEFGTLRLGQDDGAMEVMGIYPAGVSAGGYGVVFCTFSQVGGQDGGCSVGEGAFGLGPDYDADKIKWQSPRVGGVTVGLSYAPEGSQAGGGGSPNKNRAINNDPGKHSEVVGLGANWAGDFGGGKVSIGGGYTQASLEAPSADGVTDSDNTEWIIGASVTMMGITVSGNYSEDDQGKSRVKDRTTIAVGASTSTGPYTLGVTLANTERAMSDNTAVSFGVRYALGTGVSITGEVQFWDIDGLDNAMDNRATVALIGTSVSF